MTKEKEAEAPSRARPKVMIGDTVHYYDESRTGTYQIGAGPYAALVVGLMPEGLHLKVFGPHAVFDAARVKHKQELGDEPGRKSWWAHKPRD